MNRTVTVDQVMAWAPCYDRERVEQLFDGRGSLTALDILALDIPPRDRMWAVCREEVTDAATARRFACRCVRGTPLSDGRVVWDLLTDPRSRAAVEMAERYAIGEATDAELAAAWASAREAAGDAARDAWDAAGAAAWGAAWAAAGDAGDAAWATAWAAARDAAWATAWAAARGAARAAAQVWQVAELRRLLGGEA